MNDCAPINKKEQLDAMEFDPNKKKEQLKDENLYKYHENSMKLDPIK